MGRKSNHMPTYRICTHCIMDTTDPEIAFDEQGVCNHCRQYALLEAQYPYAHGGGEAVVAALVDEIKAAGKGRPYDCVMGVSGGVDSSYLAYQMHRLGLRTLAVHMDNGWNSELAVSNIEKLLNQLGIDLYTHVLDWEEFRDLQLSFLKASVPDAEIPTDHAIAAVLYDTAARHGIRYMISGTNIVTEAIMPRRWTYGIWDWRYIRGIHEQFGRVKLKRFPHYTRWSLLYCRFVKGIRSVRLLNYLPYRKEEALRVLEEELGWRNYGGKHYESIYTRFFQGYILPEKFNIDKRRAHLSTLICSRQMTREEALSELAKDAYASDLLATDKPFVIKKLGLTEAEFAALMAAPPRTYMDYPHTIPLRVRLQPLMGIADRLGLGTPKDVGI